MSYRSRTIGIAFALAIAGACLATLDSLLLYRVFGLPPANVYLSSLSTPWWRDGEIFFKIGFGGLFASIALSAHGLCRNRGTSFLNSMLAAGFVTASAFGLVVIALHQHFKSRRFSEISVNDLPTFAAPLTAALFSLGICWVIGSFIEDRNNPNRGLIDSTNPKTGDGRAVQFSPAMIQWSVGFAAAAFGAVVSVYCLLAGIAQGFRFDEEGSRDFAGLFLLLTYPVLSGILLWRRKQILTFHSAWRIVFLCIVALPPIVAFGIAVSTLLN